MLHKGSNKTLRNALLTGASGLAILLSAQAAFATATGEVANGGTSNATDANGILESNETGTVTVTIDDAANGGINFGTNGGADAITLNEAGGATALVLNVTDSAGTDTITFNENITVAGNAGNTLTMNFTNSNGVFDGNIATSAGAVAINAGSGMADPTITLTFGTSANENQTINAAINAVDATDTVNIIVNNADGGAAGAANTTTFSQAIGGTTAATAVDSILIDAATGDDTVTAIFSSSVNTGAFTITADDTANRPATATINGNLTASGVVTVTAANNAAANLTLNGDMNTATTYSLDEDTGVATMTVSGANAQMVAGNVVGAADAEGVLVVNNANGATFTGLVGELTNAAADRTLDALNIGTVDGANSSATFQTGLSATTITLGDADNTSNDTATLNLETQAAGLTVTATNINGDGANDDVATVNVLDATGGAAPDTVTITGAIGGGAPVDNLNVGSATQGGALVISGTAAATNINVIGGDNAAEDSTAEFQTAITATTVVINDNAGSATLSVNTTNGAQTIAGTFDGGAAGEGTLNVFDDDSGASDLATFSGAVGTTTASLGTVNVGNATNGGDASFGTTFAATNVNVTGGDAVGENAGAIFIGDAAITNLNVTGGSNGAAGESAVAEFRSAVNVTNATLNDDTSATATMLVNTTNGAQAVATVINGAAAGEGTLNVSDDDAGETDAATFSNAVGATNGLAAINIGTATLGGSAVFNNNVTATNITLISGNAGGETANATFLGNVTGAVAMTDTGGLASTINLNGTSAQTVSGAITAGNDGDGDINVNNTMGTVTFSGAIGSSAGNSVDDITLATGSTTVFSAAVDADRVITSGTGTSVTFGVDANTLDLDLNLADGSTLIAGSGVANGETVVTLGANTDLTGRNVTIQAPVNLADGESFTLFGGAGAGNANNATFTVTDNALFDYAEAAGVVTANRRSTSESASQLGVNTSAVDALTNSIAANTAAVQDTISTELAAGGARAKAITEKSQGDNTGGASTATTTAQTTVTTNNIVGARLDSVRGNSQTASLDTGFATGSGDMSKSAWFKAFTNLADQDERDGVSGFEADTFGFVAGIDKEVSPGVRVGVAAGYANSDVDSDSANNLESDIDQYQLSVYGDYDLGAYYLEGMLGYAYNDIETTRLTVADTVANGDYSTNQYSALIGVGKPYALSNGGTLTAKASLNYIHVEGESFTETGAGVNNQTQNIDDIDIAIARLGGSYAKEYKTDQGRIIPEFRAGVLYDLIGDEGSSTSTNAGGGAAFSTNGADVAQFGGTAGAGLNYRADGGKWDLSVNYDAEARADFLAHTGQVRARYNF